MILGLEANSTVDGRTLLSSEYPELKFLGKGLCGALTYGNVDPRFDEVTFAYHGVYTSPVIPNGKMPVFYYYTGIGNYCKIQNVYNAGGGVWRIIFYVSKNIKPEMYFFCDSLDEPASGDAYGMQLFSSAGKLMYDTGWEITRVMDLLYMSSIVDNKTATYNTSIVKPAIMFRNGYLCVYDNNKGLMYKAYLIGRPSVGILKVISFYTLKTIYPMGYTHPVPDSGGEIETLTDTGAKSIPVIDGKHYD